MELKDFIQETLAQIAAGVESAQTEVRDAGGFVNPAHRAVKSEQSSSHFGSLTSGQNIFLVDFDVTVTVVEATETEGKAKLNVAGLLNLGTGGQSNASSSATNRISLRFPSLCLSMLSQWKSFRNRMRRWMNVGGDKQSKSARTISAAPSWFDCITVRSTINGVTTTDGIRPFSDAFAELQDLTKYRSIKR